MHRQPVLDLLRRHRPADERERAMWQQTIAFVETHPDCFERSLAVGESMPGHITGSAWIISPDRTQVVLIHHRKLDRWLQPGGHADGNPDVAQVALREAQEETGLPDLQLISPEIFDVDVHEIPARGNEPTHLHYDIRFAFSGDSKTFSVNRQETKDIRWVSLGDVEDYTDDESVLRLKRKSKGL